MIFTIRRNLLDVIVKHSVIHQREARNSRRDMTEQLLMLNRWNYCSWGVFSSCWQMIVPGNKVK